MNKRKCQITIEPCGDHEAIVYNGDNGTRIILLENSPNMPSKELTAYEFMSRVVKALYLAPTPDEFRLLVIATGGTSKAVKALENRMDKYDDAYKAAL